VRGRDLPDVEGRAGQRPAGLAYVIFEAHQQAKARWQVSLPEVVTTGAAFATMAAAKAYAAELLAPELAERAGAGAARRGDRGARRGEEAASRAAADAELAANPLTLRPGLRCELRFTERTKSLVAYCYRTVDHWRTAVLLRQTWTGRWIVRLTDANGRSVNRLSINPSGSTGASARGADMTTCTRCGRRPTPPRCRCSTPASSA